MSPVTIRFNGSQKLLCRLDALVLRMIVGFMTGSRECIDSEEVTLRDVRI